MQPLIKITTEPIQITRFTQNARLISPNSVDIERRKAIARHRMMHKTGLQGSASIENLSRINRTFSHNIQNSTPQPQGGRNQSFEQLASQQQNRVASAMRSMPKVQVPNNVSASTAELSATDSASAATAANAVASATVSSEVSQSIPAQAGSSYTAQRGAFEMRVAKGELTYLPPLTMTIVTQRPSVHVEYLGGYNYVPRRTDTSTNFNLFT